MNINLSKLFDHTNLKQTATSNDIKKLCQEAKKYNFASVCVNPCYVTLAKKILKNTDVAICTVIGFPLGSNTTETKIFETKQSIKNGATEIDMVINVGKLIEKDFKYVINEIKLIKKACGTRILKVIIETSLLDNKQKIDACKAVSATKADFIKTSTGFSTGGATVDDVKILRKYCNKNIKIKASGGIRTLKDALAMIGAKADRLGVSASLAILKEERTK